jgi:hypothetical protein
LIHHSATAPAASSAATIARRPRAGVGAVEQRAADRDRDRERRQRADQRTSGARAPREQLGARDEEAGGDPGRGEDREQRPGERRAPELDRLHGAEEHAPGGVRDQGIAECTPAGHHRQA